LSHSAHPRFQRLQTEEPARVYDAVLVDSIVSPAQGLTERLEAGLMFSTWEPAGDAP
jgi:hypothetical protein